MIYILKAFKWVAMSTNVYVDIIKDNKILLYHTKSGVYKISCNSSFIELVKKSTHLRILELLNLINCILCILLMLNGH